VYDRRFVPKELGSFSTIVPADTGVTYIFLLSLFIAEWSKNVDLECFL